MPAPREDHRLQRMSPGLWLWPRPPACTGPESGPEPGDVSGRSEGIRGRGPAVGGPAPQTGCWHLTEWLPQCACRVRALSPRSWGWSPCL